MIHSQSNINLFYFNTTDLTNGYLYLQDQADYGFLGPKTILYLCQAVYAVDQQNNSAYNNLENTRYFPISQNTLSNTKHSIEMLSQDSSNTKNITIEYINKSNKINLNEFINSNYIQPNKIYSILLRDLNINSDSSENSNSASTLDIQDLTIKIYEFDSNKLNDSFQLILNYGDLGINTDVEIIIEDNNGNVINNSFAEYKWENSYLIIKFNIDDKSEIEGTWRIKYIIDADIRSNIKSSTTQYNIILNGENIVTDAYSVQYNGSIVTITHNSNNYVMGTIYDKDNKQLFLPVNYKNKNQAWLDFEDIPITFDDGETEGEHNPTTDNIYTFIMFVTKYHLDEDAINNSNNTNQNSNSNNIQTSDDEYYPSTKIKLNQIKDNDKANFVIDKLLTPSIVQYRQIRIHHELATRLSSNKYKVTYANLLDDNIQIFMNRGKIPLDNSQYSIDLTTGNITFNFSTTTHDAFEVTYSFDYFPSHILYGFLERAVSEINIGPVGTPTSYTFDTAPSYYNGLIANYAYVFCLDKLILDYDIWKGRLIFALPPSALADGSGDIISQLESLRGNAWERINISLNNAKLKAPQTLAYPTPAYFQGISPLGRYSGYSGHGFNGGKLRGLKINRYGGSF